ncbi:hypothetical protein R3P38DRAFT_3576652 [Favolaschia claudopus]|uniref:F-box domain-containing protein n=1 Tax=Favolaschia claudopus TaxID=2862362 RepID=A0AAW0DQA4_9AGAR
MCWWRFLTGAFLNGCIGYRGDRRGLAADPLAHVCSRWYHVAMKTPKLWSTFVVDANLWKDSLLPLLESSLDRGQNHPVNLTLSLRAMGFCVGEEALELFVKHAHRWRELYLHSNALPDCLVGATGKLERLEKLYWIRTRGTDESWKDIQVFQDAPRLTELVFDGFSSSLPKLPWAQIDTCTCFLPQNFECRYLPLTVLLHASCTSSYRIVLDLRSGSDESWNLEISSEVQNLEIWFSTITSVVTGKLFDCLTLPRAKTLGLRLARHFHPPVWHCDSFLALAERSQFYNGLVNLAIEKVQVEDTDLLRCLEVLPQLLSLDISDCTTVISITDKLLEGLVYSSGLSSLVPRLERLYLASKSKFSSQAYLDLVVSRAESCYLNSRGPFKAFLLQQSGWAGGELSSSVLEKLSELVSQKKIIFTWGRF